ncbi:MAG: class I SAM-dependent methyltransferase [Candidatus Pelagadaptatus aseana]|uniref:class I SAM-dependent methyltransferase n=1 Tax=Candidatus Pelagadaptatus aseana TaxID=3120508 RepID=UPI0039B2E36C
MSAPVIEASARLSMLSRSALPLEQWSSQRLFHGRGCCFPGFEQVTLDLFAPVMLLTFFKPSEADVETSLISSVIQLAQEYGLQALQVQRRYLPGAPAETVWGALPEKPVARRGELQFPICLDGRQNVGFFLDMEPGRQWLESRCSGKRVLNLFAYTCAFSVVAQAAGAAQVVNVDMSRSSLNQGRENHRANQHKTDNIKFLAENILKSWGRIRRPGPYELVIMDPPSYQPGSFVAERDYGKLLRRIPQLLVPGGDILVCLNSPELDQDFIHALMAQECPESVLVGRLPAHPDFPDEDPARQLKLFHYQYQP